MDVYVFVWRDVSSLTHQCFTDHISSVLSLGYFVYGQVSGEFFKLKYPHCKIPDDSGVSYMDMGDKICNGPLNTIGKW